MKRILLLFILFSSFITPHSHSQIQKPALGSGILKPVRWSYTFSKNEIKKGETVDLIFTAVLENDWYIYSTDLDPELGPTVTTFKFEPNSTYQLIGKIKAPNAKEKFEEVWNGKVKYFDDRAVYKQTVRILTDQPNIQGTSDYQTCRHTNGICVPGGESFAFSGLKVAAAETPETTISEPLANNSEPVGATAPTAVDTIKPKKYGPDSVLTTPDISPTAKVSQAESGVPESLWGFAIAAFLYGLAALLTPCVFPIIPMTVSYFTNQENGKWKALIYGLSIVAIYTFIGTVVSRVNGPGFANFLSTHWFPNLLFFAVFIVFGLSFLGLFEIVLPSGFVNKMDAKADRGGYTGIFFMAFTLVLVSFSCTGPLVGTILIQSAGGEVVKPIVGMAAFSLAFAIPFSLFALFPQWLKSLPRSGGWLNTVKVCLGFIELALALKFFSIADQVYHWHLLDREVYLAFWIVLFGMLGFYLLGKIRTPHDSPIEKVSVPRLILSIITLTFVVYMVPGMWGAPLKVLAGYLPPQSTIDFDLNKRTISKEGAADAGKKYTTLFHLPHELNGFFDFKEAITHARKVDKPVFIDFTGHGCVNCREMEARVWSDPGVLERLQNDFVVVALYVDDKTELPESEWFTSTYDQKVKKTIGAQNADFQIVKFNSNAQPHYCIVDLEGNLLVSPKNYDLNAANFAAFLDKGKAVFLDKTK
jgi:thiol:disulfide interchange protein